MNETNRTVLPQLQMIEAELISQESQLNAQLEKLREKRSAIQAVMPMFSASSNNAEEADAKPLQASEIKLPKKIEEVLAVAEQLATDESEDSESEDSEFEDSESEDSESEDNEFEAFEAEQTEPREQITEEQTTEKPKAEKKASIRKSDGRAADWQKYSRPGVKNSSIPEAVKLILETQPDKDFKISEVMEALFQETMPKSQYLKARNRISNVLSGGVRAGDWKRGDRGTYRMTVA